MPQNPRKLEPNRRLGPYRIRERLGRGAMATVYLADDLAAGRPVALKALHADVDSTPNNAAERMMREIELVQRIRHRGVCRIFELHMMEGIFFLTMEYLPGRTLEEELRRVQRLSLARTIRIGRALCHALNAAHALGIVHRDLKPGNVMLRPGDEPSILDFGLATGPNVGRVTLTGQWVGTLHYLAPELLRDEKASGQSDLYAMGVILFQCLTGGLPFSGLTFGEIASALLYRDPPRCRERAADIPQVVDDVVKRALEREPGRRFSDVMALAAALARVAPVEAPPPPAPAPPEDTTEPSITLVDADTPDAARVVEAATILVCEAIGQSTPAAETGPGSGDALLAQLAMLLRAEIDRWRGQVVPEAEDATVARFATADDAVRAAMAVQRAWDLAGQGLGGPGDMVVLHIGIATGELVVRGRDQRGEAISKAARVCWAADAGEILVSAATVAGLRAPNLRRACHAATVFKGPKDEELAFRVEWDVSARTEVLANPLQSDSVTAARRPATPQRRWETAAPPAREVPRQTPAAQTIESAAPSPKTEKERLSAAVEAARSQKGIVSGDNMTLDGLEKTAMLEFNRGNLEESCHCLRLALEELESMQVDEAFVAEKVGRFDRLVRDRVSFKEIACFRNVRQGISEAVQAGDTIRANLAINEALVSLNKKR